MAELLFPSLSVSVARLNSVLDLENVDQKPYNSYMKPYSPDLAPCDFWAFSPVKRELRGTKFRSDKEIKISCSTVLLKLAANGLQHVFEKRVDHYKKCISCQERYFEKETVTAPPQSSDSE
jgi:hypothetical protein